MLGYGAVPEPAIVPGVREIAEGGAGSLSGAAGAAAIARLVTTAELEQQQAECRAPCTARRGHT